MGRSKEDKMRLKKETEDQGYLRVEAALLLGSLGLLIILVFGLYEMGREQEKQTRSWYKQRQQIEQLKKECK